MMREEGEVLGQGLLALMGHAVPCVSSGTYEAIALECSGASGSPRREAALRMALLPGPLQHLVAVGLQEPRLRALAAKVLGAAVADGGDGAVAALRGVGGVPGVR